MSEQEPVQDVTRGFIASPVGQIPTDPPDGGFGPLTREERDQYAFLRAAVSGLDETLTLEPMRVLHDGLPRVALVAMKNVGDEVLATPLALLIDGPMFEGMAQPGRLVLPGDDSRPAPPEVKAEALRDLLLLVDDEFPAHLPVLATIRSWSTETQRDVQRWAMAVHLVASDNDDVEIPPMPEVLRNS